jgi:glycosyltransferase involved in cell wall biosynthesis
VGAVANYRPRKGLEKLIESAHDLPREAEIHFLLIGRGTDHPRLTKMLAASPFRSRFHALGFRRDACSLIAACDCSVLPSVKREGLPKTVIESMAYGICPVVTDTGGSAELVISGESGLVVPPGDAGALAKAVIRLYENPEETRRMGARARQRIEKHFNIRQTVEKTLEVYQELLKD